MLHPLVNDVVRVQESETEVPNIICHTNRKKNYFFLTNQGSINCNPTRFLPTNNTRNIKTKLLHQFSIRRKRSISLSSLYRTPHSINQYPSHLEYFPPSGIAFLYIIPAAFSTCRYIIVFPHNYGTLLPSALSCFLSSHRATTTHLDDSAIVISQNNLFFY